MNIIDQHAAEIIKRREAGEKLKDIADGLGLEYGYLRQWVSARKVKKLKPIDTQFDPEFSEEGLSNLDLEALLNVARVNQTVLNKIDPIITHETRELKNASAIGIILTSCAHLGGRYTLYKEFQQIFNTVLQTPNLYWLSLGDDIEGFLPKFINAAAVTDQAIANPKVQRTILKAIISRLVAGDKLIAGCASQHGGDWWEKQVGDNPIKNLYLRYGVPYFDGKGILSLHIRAQKYILALGHEFPGSSLLNSNHSQRRAGLYDFPRAHVIVQGDKHKYAVQEFSVSPIEYDAGLSDSYMKWLVQVGTAKAGLDKYSIRGWSRGVLEWPIMILHGSEHYIEFTRSLTRARQLLTMPLR